MKVYKTTKVRRKDGSTGYRMAVFFDSVQKLSDIGFYAYNGIVNINDCDCDDIHITYAFGQQICTNIREEVLLNKEFRDEFAELLHSLNLKLRIDLYEDWNSTEKTEVAYL